jgi:small subunit ribosomal protein S5
LARPARDDSQVQELEERVIHAWRCATVMKGGRRVSFGALVVVGNGNGSVGWGYGKAQEVPAAIEKAIRHARKSLVRVPLVGGTIPHEVIGNAGASKVVLVPASAGTGVIAGAVVRAVADCAGIRDLLTKSLGSHNAKNLVKAAFDALSRVRTRELVEKLRGVTLS